MKVEIITGQYCTKCKTAKMLLAKYDQDYTEYDTSSQFTQDKIKEHSFSSIPQIFVDGEWIRGDQTRLKEILERSKE